MSASATTANLPIHTIRKIERVAEERAISFDDAVVLILRKACGHSFCPVGDTTQDAAESAQGRGEGSRDDER